MPATLPSQIPVLIRFAGSSSKADAWGRLTALSARAARLTTLAPAGAGEYLELDFELCGERFDSVPCRVASVSTDCDGYRWIEADFPDELARRRLARVLVGVLATPSR